MFDIFQKQVPHLMVNSSVFSENSPYVSSAISCQVSNVSFEDFDLDAMDLGGNLTWALAENEANRPIAIWVSSTLW